MFSQIIDQWQHKNKWYKFGSHTWCCKAHPNQQCMQALPHDVMMWNPEPAAGDSPAWYWFHCNGSTVQAPYQAPFLVSSWRQRGTPLPDFSTPVQFKSARPLISNHRVWVLRESEKTATRSVFLLRYLECQDFSSSCSSLPILPFFSPPLPLAQCQGGLQMLWDQSYA